MTVTEPSVATGDYDAQWEGHWKSGVKVNEKWDKGTSAPALKELLKDEGVATQGKAVLVPGCGRGYDLVEFIK